MTTHNSAESNAGVVTAPQIRRLEIQRFRGIRHLIWWPAAGLNVILGGGDVGKTTILDAIGLLFSPVNPTNVGDVDYYAREYDNEFLIEAVMSLPDDTGIHHQGKQAWPWDWNGREAVPPTQDAEQPPNDPVFRLRARGTDQLEIAYEILQPNGSTETLSHNLRRAIGLIRLGGDDRNDRDLRLVQGSALDRLLSDPALRSRITNELAQSKVVERLLPEKRQTLTELDGRFQHEHLPSGLSLALTGGAGPSVASMVGLTATRDNIPLPLASWGSGTRRLAALAIAEQTQGAAPVTIVDEIERGLEPYRQRVLVQRLLASKSQAFVTTHSPAAIRCAAGSAIWYLDGAGNIGRLQGEPVRNLINRSSDALLARLTLIMEGPTELGFVGALLQRFVGGSLEPHGIHLVNGHGHEQTLQLLEALKDVGLTFGGFVDNENRYATRWRRIATARGALLYQWPSGNTDNNIINAVADGALASLIEDPSGKKTGLRYRSMADRLGLRDKQLSLPLLAQAAKDNQSDLRSLVLAAAIGTISDGLDEETEKAFRRHPECWFKSVDGGRELEAKMFSLGLWPGFKRTLAPFCDAVLAVVGKSQPSDLL